MGARSRTWMERRGVGSSEREFNAPWVRLQEHLVERYGRDVAQDRRWERPDPHDLANLALLLRQASAAVDADVGRAGRACSPALTPCECDVLRRVAAKPSAGSNLAAYLRLTPQRVSQVLRRLESRGLIEREESFRDARERRASVTEAGRTVLRTLDPRLQALATLWLDELDHEGEEARTALMMLVAVLADLT